MQPGQQKISQFTPVDSTESGDIIPIVRNGQNRSITVDKFTGIIPDGWLAPVEEWSFLSASTFTAVITVPEGDINRYPKYTRVWFKQGMTPVNKYAVVLSSTSNTITVLMLNGATLENLAIQQPFISQQNAPITPDNTNFSDILAKMAIRYSDPSSGQVVAANSAANPVSLDQVNIASTHVSARNMTMTTGKIYAHVSGTYTITGMVSIVDSPQGNNGIQITKNGVKISAEQHIAYPTVSRGTNITVSVDLQAGDYVSMIFLNLSGNNTRIGQLWTSLSAVQVS